MKFFFTLLMYVVSLQATLGGVENLRIYSGRIHNRYAIEMHLSIHKQSVYGYYFYLSQKKPVPLTGEIKGSHIKLIEGDIIEEDVYFDGTLKGDILAGKWIDTSNDKSFSFFVKADATLSKNFQTENEKLAGEYESPNNDDEYLGNLTIQYIDKNLFYFDISTATEAGCVGSLVGTLELKENHIGYFSNEECKQLQFNFSQSRCLIKETKCPSHGVLCPFAGEYVKPNTKRSIPNSSRSQSPSKNSPPKKASRVRQL